MRFITFTTLVAAFMTVVVTSGCSTAKTIARQPDSLACNESNKNDCSNGKESESPAKKYMTVFETHGAR